MPIHTVVNSADCILLRIVRIHGRMRTQISRISTFLVLAPIVRVFVYPSNRCQATDATPTSGAHVLN